MPVSVQQGELFRVESMSVGAARTIDVREGPDLEPEETIALVQRALHAVRRHLDMEVAFVSRFDEGRMEFRHVVGDAAVFAIRHGEVVDISQELCRHIERTGELVALSDVTIDTGGSDAPHGRHRLRSYFGAPIVRPDGTLFGSLCGISTDARPDLDPREGGVLRAVADVLSHALEQEDQRLIEDRRTRGFVRRLVSEGLLEMVYQPIRRLANGSVVGIEALARFPDGASPSSWFARAHGAGLGAELEIVAVQEALGVLDRLPAGCYLSINVSPAVAGSGELHRLLDGVPAGHVVVELTEHSRVSDYDALADAVGELRDRGCRVAIDDVGAGYASFRHVMELLPDIVKVDRSLVAGLHRHAARRAFLTGLMATAAEIGVAVVAEGIEQDAELAALTGAGIEVGQGFLLGRPGPYPELS